MANENIKETVDEVLKDIAERREAAQEKAAAEPKQDSKEANKETAEPKQDSGEQNKDAEKPEKDFKEITLKFGKGCVGEPFTGKDGKEYVQILIPNANQDDHRSWETFVARANHVHEDKFGKGMWLKLPAEGQTTLQRSVVVGENEDGKKEYGTEKRKVPNTELKKMVEFYKDKDKDRDSLKDKLSEKKEAASQENSTKPPKQQNKSKEAAI